MEMNVPGKDVFLAVIDLSLALIGFSSIVTALRRSKEKSWSQQEINGLVFLAGMAIGAILFALLPFALFYMGIGEHVIYRIAALVYVLFGLLVALALFIRGRRSGYPSRRPRVFNTFTFLSLLPLVVMALLAAGRFTQGLMGVYLLGVFWLLILAFIQFLMFLSFVGFTQEESSDKTQL